MTAGLLAVLVDAWLTWELRGLYPRVWRYWYRRGQASMERDVEAWRGLVHGGATDVPRSVRRSVRGHW